MPQIINLSPIGEVLPGDSLPIFDESNGDTRRVSVGQLSTYMSNTLSLPDNAADIDYDPAGTGAVQRSVQSKLREGANVNAADFGAGTGKTAAENSTAFANAISHLKANGGSLTINPGTYQVNQVEIASAGSNDLQNFTIYAQGARLQGNTSSPTLRLYRAQGLVIDGLRVSKHASATYASTLEDFWFANCSNCDFGKTVFIARDGWSILWNEFNGCYFDGIHMDLTNGYVNQNVWKGGRIGPSGITKTNATHPLFKQAYNNVFIGVDFTGSIDWRDPSPEFRYPLVLRDSNMEYAGINYGYIIATGGVAAQPSGTVQYFPWDDMRSEFEMEYTGGNWVVGWKPQSPVNLIRGGACQQAAQDIYSVYAAAQIVSYADASSPTGSGQCWRLYQPGASYAGIVIKMPDEALAQAKTAGFVSFSFDIYTTQEPSFRVNRKNTLGTGDDYPTGLTFPTNQWVKRFINVPINSTDAGCILLIGGSSLTNFDVRVANVACHIGKVAYPYAPASGEPSAKRGRVFTKTLTGNGSAQNVFSFTLPASQISGRVHIKAVSDTADQTGVYEGMLYYSRNNVVGGTNVSLVKIGGVQMTYGPANDGMVTTMSASATGGTVTVTVTPSSLGGRTADANFEVEFLDRDETLTVL
jgi:hypothetical protein